MFVGTCIEKIEHKGLTIKIKQDDNPIDPRTEFDNLGTMVCFHRRYSLGDKHEFRNPDELNSHMRKTDAIFLPVYMYDHSGLAINTTGFSNIDPQRWDWGQLGYIFVEAKKAREEYKVKRITKKLKEQIKKNLLAEVETYHQYVSGEIYGFEIFKGEDFIDSCWGFYGIDYCKQEATSAADNEIEHQEKEYNRIMEGA